MTAQSMSQGGRGNGNSVNSVTTKDRVCNNDSRGDLQLRNTSKLTGEGGTETVFFTLPKL
jgi:hypothetical protein